MTLEDGNSVLDGYDLSLDGFSFEKGSSSITISTTEVKTEAVTGKLTANSGRVETPNGCVFWVTGNASDQEFVSDKPSADPVNAYFRVVTDDIGYGYLEKIDKATGTKLKGAVYGIYSDILCTKLVEQMVTGDNGGCKSGALRAGTYYVKEITSPNGYVLDSEVHTLVVKPGETAWFTAKDDEQKGSITIYKEGEVLTGYKSLEGLASYIISEDMANRMGKREEELFGLAAENMKHLFPVQILPAHDALMMVLEDQEAPEWVLDVGRMVEEGAPKLYVITNNAHMNGASAILYEEGLHELAEKLEDDLYLLPSSIHEMIAIPANDIPPEDLAQMVYEANQSIVCLGDRLSNEVYRYDRRLRTIEAAANTPYKRLDDMDQKYDKEYAIARNKEWKASVIEEEGQAPRVELTELNLNESRQRGSR